MVEISILIWFINQLIMIVAQKMEENGPLIVVYSWLTYENSDYLWQWLLHSHCKVIWRYFMVINRYWTKKNGGCLKKDSPVICRITLNTAFEIADKKRKTQQPLTSWWCSMIWTYVRSNQQARVHVSDPGADRTAHPSMPTLKSSAFTLVSVMRYPEVSSGDTQTLPRGVGFFGS